MILSILIFAPDHVTAQWLHFPATDESNVSLEFMKPNFKNITGIKTASSVWFLGTRVQSNDQKFSFIGEIPVAYYAENSFDIYTGIRFLSELLVGNPLLAFEIRGKPGKYGGFALIGFRPPLVGKRTPNAQFYGIFTDFDRFEAFARDQFSFLLGSGTRLDVSSSRLKSEIDLGFTTLVVIPTVGQIEPEVYAKYYIQGWLFFSRVSFNAEFTGVGYLSGDGGSIGERTEHQISFGTQFSFGNCMLGAFIRVPIADELKQVLDFVGGVNFILSFPQREAAVTDWRE